MTKRQSAHDAEASTRQEAAASPPSFERLQENEGAPLYEVIKRRILEAILSGAWAPGTTLPSENALAGEFGVSVGTTRKALAELTSEGMLMRRRKTGTVVTGWAPLHNLRYFFQYFRLHDKQGALLRSRTQLLEQRRAAASEDEAQRLKLSPGEEVIHLHRLRHVGDIPAMQERLVLPARHLPDFPGPEGIPQLFYLFLLERYGIRVAAVREQLTAELATEEDISLLALKPPQAVLVIDEVSFDQNAMPVILAHHRVSTQHFIYVNEVR